MGSELPGAAVRAEPMGTRARLAAILTVRSDRIALVAVGVTAAIASIAEASVLVTITLLGLRLADDSVSAVDLPFDVPLDELSSANLVVVGFTLLFLRLCVLGLNAWIGARLSEAVLFRWRRRVVDAFLSASWERQMAEDEGHLQTVTQTYVASVSNVIQQLASALTAGMSFLTFVVGAFVLHPLAALALAVFGIVIFVAVRPLTAYVRRMAGRQRDAALEYARLLGELVAMPQEARVFSIEPELVERLNARLREFVAARRRGMIAQRITPQTFQTLGLVIVLSGLAIASRFDLSDTAILGALVLLLIRSLSYGQTFQSTYQSVVSSQPMIEGLLSAVSAYEATAPQRGEETISSVSVVKFEGVSLEYSESTVLTDVDLEIPAGESLGIIGPSGSGKSTLAAALLGLLEPSAGTLTADGRPIQTIEPRSWADLVSFVPQEPKLFDATVRENIAFLRPDIDDRSILDAALAANLGREIEQWGGLDYVVGPRGSKLSGGQRQRVCIARSLASTPSMLILDEPTSSLDGESEELITDVLRSLRGQCTMVVIAHRLTTLEFCDRIVLVDGGSVVEIGSGPDIQEKDSMRRLVERALATESST